MTTILLLPVVRGTEPLLGQLLVAAGKEMKNLSNLFLRFQRFHFRALAAVEIADIKPGFGGWLPGLLLPGTGQAKPAFAIPIDPLRATSPF